MLPQPWILLPENQRQEAMDANKLTFHPASNRSLGKRQIMEAARPHTVTRATGTCLALHLQTKPRKSTFEKNTRSLNAFRSGNILCLRVATKEIHASQQHDMPWMLRTAGRNKCHSYCPRIRLVHRTYYPASDRPKRWDWNFHGISGRALLTICRRQHPLFRPGSSGSE